MKLNKLINLLIVILLLFVSSKVGAQIDTVHMQYTHINQYIYPHLMDPSYTSVTTYNIQYQPVGSPFQMHINVADNQGFLSGFSQRYEVRNDSVKIMGVALLIRDVAMYTPGETRQITISIWDSTMTNEIYSKPFIDATYMDTFQTPPNSSLPFFEFIFNDTLTLYEDYHVAIEYPKRCEGVGVSVPAFMGLSDYACIEMNHGCCEPYGISTKYKPYVKFCCDEGRTDWRYVDSVNNWTDPQFTYSVGARYQWLQDYINDPNSPWYNDPNSEYYDPDVVLCDTVVYQAIGICPIRALENSTTGNDSTGIGGGSAGDDTTSTGGGSQDSYIATVLADEDIELYPNPADEVLNIRSDYNITEIEVIDAMNRVIERWELNTRELTLDVASYKSGTYFIIIKTDKGSLTKKFIVR